MKTTQIFQLQKLKDLTTLQPLIKQILALKNISHKKIEQLKTSWAKQYKTKLPLNAELFQAATPQQKEKLRKIILTKPNRTLSGVSIIAIMPEPTPCIWGKCIYCPKGEDSPHSYLGYEPATMRARGNKYDAFKQVTNRLSQLQNIGHAIDKNELILIGGTFPALNWNYQKSFVRDAFNAFNNFNQRHTSQTSNTHSPPPTILKTAQKLNETAKHRVVGMTIETRPDYCPIKKLLQLGTTRVELGVQSIYDPILKNINRGHSIKDVYKATSDLKNAGLKVLYHIMPGLPGSTYKSDVAMFKTIFADDRLKPDMLKIYPCLVIKGTELYNKWKKGDYKPITNKYMHNLLKKVYEICPPWIRIMRVQRDIPAPFIEAGPKKSNIRELVVDELKKAGISSNEIRFREAGRVSASGNFEINTIKYSASNGIEYFISAEDKNKTLASSLRLRFPLKSNNALVRELHVYGVSVPIGQKGEIQHQGLGKKLLAEAEHLAKQNNKKHILVISGIGVRQYYYKLGYKLKAPYVFKAL